MRELLSRPAPAVLGNRLEQARCLCDAARCALCQGGMLHWTELRDWLATRLNRPFTPRPPQTFFWGLYAQGDQPLREAPQSLRSAAAESTDLLVVLTTYRRPEACARVLQQLADALAQEPSLRAHLLVLNDRSDADYSAVRRWAQLTFGARTSWLDSVERQGKPGFWRVYQVAFLAAELLCPTHALFLQDDLELPPHLLSQVRALWQASAGDARRRVLYLFSSQDDERWGRWVLFRRRPGPDGLRLTQWFDLQAFFVDLRFFQLLQFRMLDIHPNRWRRRPSVSSGVGRQLTRRLFGRASVYQAHPALVRHGGQASQMNPEARARRSLDNRRD